MKATGWKDKAQMQQRTQAVLEKVHLGTKGFKMPHELSGGEQQRVVIARALVNEPEVILADEPTGNLDTTTGNVILNLLQRLTREHHTATVMATHSLEAAALADAVVHMRDGIIEEVIRR